MAKSTATDADSALRTIPSVEKILSSTTFAELVGEYGRDRVKEGVAEHLAVLRANRQGWDQAAALAAVADTLGRTVRSTLRRTINGSGVIIHTNLGRSPVDPAIWAEAAELVTSYSNLEFDLETGGRGRREEHLTSLCRSLFGCEAALLTNNNAAGTMLVVSALAAGREVIVSRGELVEIGGAFRVPDVIQQGGAKLREVGTTNRTRARDYADAVSRRTGALLRVHRSNFEIVGFTETARVDELVEVSRAKKVPLVYDEGSGRVVDLAPYGFAYQETLRELIVAGVDVVSCSTDKLIGATQGGLILGTAEQIEKCRKHPLMRALRVGKETYAIVAATLRAFDARRYEERIPIYRMLATSIETLRERGERIARGTDARIVESRCALGGGTTPAETIASLAIEVPGNATALHERFLKNDPPIVGRIQDDRFTIELRTLLNDDVTAVRKAVSLRG